jgi:hypothetical protein
VPRPTPGTDNRVLLVCRLLNRHRVRYLIAGGVAANLHGSVRATKDVDVLVLPDARNMRRLLDALSALPQAARPNDWAHLSKLGQPPPIDSPTRRGRFSAPRSGAPAARSVRGGVRSGRCDTSRPFRRATASDPVCDRPADDGSVVVDDTPVG